MPVSKSDARRLTKEATEIGAHVLRGVLTVGPEGAKIGETDILAWLTQYAHEELMLIVAPIGKIFIESEVKICYTCGRDYTGDNCPHCAEARARLRGE
ncbi:MAG: hypothetical protein JW953_21580 [Anaerolineae bacterium]|nr:hypothetical protein [Anaerolineae bacterium]